MSKFINCKYLPVLLILIGIGCLISFLNVSQKNYSKEKVASVDYYTLMMNHPDTIKAQTELQKEISSSYEIMNNSNLSAEEKKAKYLLMENNLKNKEKELYEPIKNKVDECIDKVLKKNNISILLDKRAVLRNNNDITYEILLEEGVSEEQAKQLTSSFSK